MSGNTGPPLSDSVLALVNVYKEVRQLAMSRFSGDSGNAEDLLHDIYVTVFERPPLLVVEPKAYMSRALANGAVSSARRRQREPLCIDTQELSWVCETRPEMRGRDMADETAAERELQELVQRLPPHLAATLLLLKRDGWTYEEVAAALDISVSTVSKHLAQAIALCSAMEAKAKSGRGK
jgi:RNA polymerase sigma factor (sigma-70 family)